MSKSIEKACIEPLLSRRQVQLITTLSRSTLYRLVAQNAFPKPIKVSPNRRAWRATDVDTWLEARLS
ncbi:MAG: AlpA family phage regulatory protein [Hyphomicrobiaceae bacterium]|nr:AlpA family phage regulatory protein [Hyphomicrobiaceae bacterium]